MPPAHHDSTGTSGAAGLPSGSGVLAVLSIAGVVAIAGTIFLFGTLSPSSGSGLAVGQIAPAIHAAGWVNGEPPSPLGGRIVVVDAWAPWCQPCRAKAPELVQTWQQFKDRGVVFIGLTSDEADSLPQIQQFIDEIGIEWPNGYGANETMTAFQVEYIPSLWVIGADGKVVWNHNSRGSLADGIEQALAAAK